MNADLPGQYPQVLALGEAVEPMYANRHNVALPHGHIKSCCPTRGKAKGNGVLVFADQASKK
jgi:hypothetical protein